MLNSSEDINMLNQTLHQLEIALPGLELTKYLSAVGTVILLYDFLLLLPEEISLVWTSEWSSSKILFLINRYLTPILFIINNHSLGAISSAGLSTMFCRIWLPFTAVLGVTSLAIANFFVTQRVYLLSARDLIIKRILIIAFIAIYSLTYASVILASIQFTPHVEFSPTVKSCFPSEKPKFLIVTYSIPIALDGLVFLLACYNALNRPRHLDSFIVRQLIYDGLIYFLSLLSLRLFNIVSIAVLDIQYSQLGAFFIWAVITTLVNRMIITRGIEAESDPALYDLAARQTPFRPAYRDLDDSDSFIQWNPDILDEYFYHHHHHHHHAGEHRSAMLH